MTSRKKFLVTSNLNRLAKWLRILGYDVLVMHSTGFDVIRKIAVKDRRIYLTRDRKEAASNHKFARILIKSDDYLQQLTELQQLLEFDENYVFSRCSQCNRLLVDIPKTKIKDKIPEYIYQNFEDFKYCRRCGKIYWQGSHYKRMKNIVKEIIDK